MSILVCIGCGTAHADSRPISFEEVLRASLVSSPEVAKIDSSLSERLAESAETRVKSNPSLAMEVRVPPDRPERAEYALSISQPLRPSDFGLRLRVSKLIEEVGSLERSLSLLEFTQNLALTYAKAWAIQERRAVLLRSRGEAQEMLRSVRRVAAKGVLPEGDVATFEGELGLLAAEILGSEADSKRGMAELTRTSGTNFDGTTLRRPSEPPRLAEGSIASLMQEATLPAMRRAELLGRVASRQRELARLDSYPRIAPGLGFERTSEKDNQVTAGITVDLPLFDRNQAAQLRALAAQRTADSLRLYAASGRIDEEARLLLSAFESARSQRERMERDVTPARERALRGYQKQWEAGQGTAFQVWQAERELTDARLRALDIWSQERGIRAELGILLGEAF